jgi:hypothetical protein
MIDKILHRKVKVKQHKPWKSKAAIVVAMLYSWMLATSNLVVTMVTVTLAYSITIDFWNLLRLLAFKSSCHSCYHDAIAMSYAYIGHWYGNITNISNLMKVFMQNSYSVLYMDMMSFHLMLVILTELSF